MSRSIPKQVVCIFVAALTVLTLSPGRTASAVSTASLATATVKPATVVNTQGSSVGTVASMRVKDQSGTVDTPMKYVLFQTPGLTYQGYRGYMVPSTISPGAVTQIQISANYKGPAKATQTWSWYLYDWVDNSWEKVGDNTGAANNVWKMLNFPAVTTSPSRFINNDTRQIRLRLTSNNASSDAKLDFEKIVLTYEPCTGSLGCVYVGATDPIHIAYHLSVPELQSYEGATIAIDDWGGMILGHGIQFDGVSNPDCDPTEAGVDANEMIRDGSIVAVIGTSCSVEASAVISPFTGAGFWMMSPSNTFPGLTAPGTVGYFRVAVNDGEQARLAAEYADGVLAATSAAIIHDGSEYSSALAQHFADEFLAATVTGTITMTKTIGAGEENMIADLEDISTSDGGGAPDVIYMPVFMPAGSYIVNQARAMSSLASTYLIGADGLWDELLMLSTGTDGEGFRLTGLDETQFTSLYDPWFVGAFEDKYGVPPDSLFAAFGFDAFDIVAQAIYTSAVDLGGGALLIDREALLNQLYEPSMYPLLTGTIDCDSSGECAQTPALGVFEMHKNTWGPTLIYP